MQYGNEKMFDGMTEDEETRPRKRAAVGKGDFPTILPESVTSFTTPWTEVCAGE